MVDLGITVQSYHSDNGIFAAPAFMHEIKKGLQNIKFSGVGAPHQNSIAEQGIQTILMKAQRLLIHAAIHWPTQADSDLLPMTFDYALHHHNHMPHPLLGCFPL